MHNKEPAQTNDTAFNQAVTLLAQRFNFSDLALAQAMKADPGTIGTWRLSLEQLSPYDKHNFRFDELLIRRRVLISKLNILLAHLSHQANLRQLLDNPWPGALDGKSLHDIALTLPRKQEDPIGLEMVCILLEDWANTNVPNFEQETYWLEA